jgi:spermidine synthase
MSTTVDARILHKERSLYSTILVDQRGSMLCLQFSVRRDQRNQSCFDQRKPDNMVFIYARMMMASLLLQPQPKRILMIGLGGGTLPMALDRLFPEATQDVVEIDEAVVRVAKDYFGFAPSDRVKVFAQDGRVFAKRAVQRGEKYDLIMLDAFNGDYIPEHLMTREFLEEVKALLTPDGVLAANTFSISRLYDHESVTYANVFGTYFNLRTPSTGNRIVLATPGGLPTTETLRARGDDLSGPLKPYGISMRELLPMMREREDWDSDARELTDQYAPANILQSQ